VRPLIFIFSYNLWLFLSCIGRALTAALDLQVKVMVHERDELMVKRLLECEGTVVGVVGMAHMDGIERLWKEAGH
jgi:pheromone shutdown protein TraB